MQQILFISVLFVGAVVLAFVMVATATSTVQVSKRWSGGILQYFFYALFISNSVMTVLSGRDLSGLNLPLPTTGGNPVISWSLRLTSLFLLLAALDQCVRFFRAKPPIHPTRALMAAGIVLLWFTNVVAPAFWSAHATGFYYPWAYQPILMIGLLCLTAENGRMVISHCRNAAVVFCSVSLVLAAVYPSSFIDTNYIKGFLTGLPRLSGLATHPVAMGLISASGFWCLIYAPFKSRKLTAVGLLICGVALLLSQSKTTWVGFFLGLPVMFFYRQRNRASQGDPGRNMTAVFAFGSVCAMALIMVLLTLQLFGFSDGQIDKFTQSDVGARMFSLTGRDLIWDVALDEWRRSPVFGYGPDIFDLKYRLQIGMLFATDGHNQFFDALARAGIVGAIGAAAYSCIIAWVGVQYSRRSNGLSLILAISLLVRTISEVPFVLTVTNLSDTAHYLLICVIVGCLRDKTQRTSPESSKTGAKFQSTLKTC